MPPKGKIINVFIFCEDVCQENHVVCLVCQYCSSPHGTGICVEGDGNPVVLVYDENHICPMQKLGKPRQILLELLAETGETCWSAAPRGIQHAV